jgi:hypothetical protein
MGPPISTSMAAFDLDDTDTETETLLQWSGPLDVALHASMQLAVVFSLALALILILGQRIA